MSSLVWLIGGGILQMPMAQEIKRRGYRLLVTDGNAQAPVRQLADSFLQVSTYDINAHLDLLDSMPELPIAILTDAADIGPTVSALTEFLGLPGIPYKVALQVRDKSQMREQLEQQYPVHAVVTPEMYPCDAWLLWERTAQRREVRRYPCVVKASDNCASRGMSFVRDPDDLAEAIYYAQQNNRLAKNILIEQFLSGPEYATDWLVVDGKVIFANGAARVFGKLGIELGHTNPWWPPQAVIDLAQTAASKLSVGSGPFKLDLIQDTQYGWLILEAATRWSGGFDHGFTAKLATGRNLEKPLLDYALGLPFDEYDLLPQWYTYAAAYAPVYEPGYISGFAGLAEAEKMPGVSEIIVLQEQQIQQLQNCAQRVLFVLAVGDTEKTAWQNAVHATSVIEPRYK